MGSIKNSTRRYDSGHNNINMQIAGHLLFKNTHS